MNHDFEPSWRRAADSRPRQAYRDSRDAPYRRFADSPRRDRKRPASDTQEDLWLADESNFVLRQERKKAEIRVRENRAKPIDRLAVALRFIDQARGQFDDEDDDLSTIVVDPEVIIDSLSYEELESLQGGIKHYLALERADASRQYWETILTICRDRLEKQSNASDIRGIASVTESVDKLFRGKTHEQLETQEKGIQAKLDSDEPINDEFWSHALEVCRSRKARARLREVSKSIVASQMKGLRHNATSDALGFPPAAGKDAKLAAESTMAAEPGIQIGQSMAMAEGSTGSLPQSHQNPPSDAGTDSAAAAAFVQREEARGAGENEEMFTGEEQVTSRRKEQSSDEYNWRKPRYFNRVQMGYDWNKYNQTHYDHDNPPPKVVQGYRFNVFYPDLIDIRRAPTYRIERENGRRKGQSSAVAGEDDTCLIRFMSGPPYEDIAFRIVDKEWDYSAKRERGFKSSFDKGILQLHFQFKKIFYRK